MYWLRRIPAETRIVVLVVFLALFQAILLSVFGLGAIRGERRTVEEKVRESAEDFLRHYVVTRCQNDLRDRADAVFLEAYAEDGTDRSMLSATPRKRLTRRPLAASSSLLRSRSSRALYCSHCA